MAQPSASTLVFGRHASLLVDWATGLSPTVETCTLQGWVKQHQKALDCAYQVMKKQRRIRPTTTNELNWHPYFQVSRYLFVTSAGEPKES